MSSGKYSPISTTEQPRASHVPTMDPTRSPEVGEKGIFGEGCNSPHGHGCETCESTTADSQHRRCHNGRLRRFLAPFLVVLLLMGGLAALSCASGHGMSDLGWESLMSRAVDGTTNGTGGAFVHNKLYLIVVFVGLFVVLILAIMLSAWCCRGAFENPCCCPCYLCACCGGLACLECIACGLCAEGIEQA